MKINEQTMLNAVEAALLDDDGSCRDINFEECISTSGAIGVLHVLAAYWQLRQAKTYSGEDIPYAALARFLEQRTGALSTLWDDGSNPKHIQAFFYWDAAGSIFCELTFFPQDFDRAHFSLNEFLRMLSKLVSAAHSKEYYVRFENASWQHGKPMKHGNVILSHKKFPLPIAGAAMNANGTI
ncbi:hypothetical protein O0880_12115 [Janthinobacterium sp. SUN118]|uniref:hypothetical protein n=1 Tax=Janthinobacterium sp. SUN118 TaxID=3004100 RepID=UPI0025B0CDDC|nr:hypothetical protein [Janthinobacterium sp. SUN118]MDN2710164.1 hypothetical protein [Janthinobacterium sp. SUN118]